MADFKKDANLRLKVVFIYFQVSRLQIVIKIYIQTHGNSHLVESITGDKPEQAGANYRGEDVLNTWDNRIQNFKVVTPGPTSAEAPVDDDEW